MRFSYASPARLADIPCLDAASLRAAILTQVAHGWRVLAFFGLPRALYAQGELALVAGNTAAAGLCGAFNRLLDGGAALFTDKVIHIQSS